jgi:hypothetical protein
MPVDCARVAHRAATAPLARRNVHLALEEQRNDVRPEIATRRRATWGALALLASLVLAPAGAGAARLVDVRVGVHPGYARVVFETDAAAAHEVIEHGAREVVVRIAAASDARRIAPRADGAPSVELVPTADGATLARIAAVGPLRVETQVLAAPPRVVLDLRPAERAAEAEPIAAAPEPPREEPSVPSEPAPLAEEPPAEPPRETAEASAPPAPAPTPEPVAAPAPLEPPPPAVLPPVDAAPPASLAFEPRSLATGLAIGFAAALFVFAAMRPSRKAASPADPATEAAPTPPPVDRAAGSEAVASELARAPAPAPPADPSDYGRMHRRLEARLDELATRLDDVATRQQHLDATGAAHGLEIASQRAAIARLRRSSIPAPPPPRDAEREEEPPTAHPG